MLGVVLKADLRVQSLNQLAKLDCIFTFFEAIVIVFKFQVYILLPCSNFVRRLDNLEHWANEVVKDVALSMLVPKLPDKRPVFALFSVQLPKRIVDLVNNLVSNLTLDFLRHSRPESSFESFLGMHVVVDSQLFESVD